MDHDDDIVERFESFTMLATDADGRTRVLYPYRRLKAPGPYPGDVDIKKRESYMLERDFPDALGVSTLEAFLALPKWKQERKKKDAGLF